MQVVCPNCQSVLEVGEENLREGCIIACPACQTSLAVSLAPPTADTPPEEGSVTDPALRPEAVDPDRAAAATDTAATGTATETEDLTADASALQPSSDPIPSVPPPSDGASARARDVTWGELVSLPAAANENEPPPAASAAGRGSPGQAAETSPSVMVDPSLLCPTPSVEETPGPLSGDPAAAGEPALAAAPDSIPAGESGSSLDKTASVEGADPGAASATVEVGEVGDGGHPSAAPSIDDWAAAAAKWAASGFPVDQMPSFIHPGPAPAQPLPTPLGPKPLGPKPPLDEEASARKAAPPPLPAQAPGGTPLSPSAAGAAPLPGLPPSVPTPVPAAHATSPAAHATPPAAHATPPPVPPVLSASQEHDPTEPLQRVPAAQPSLPPPPPPPLPVSKEESAALTKIVTLQKNRAFPAASGELPSWVKGALWGLGCVVLMTLGAVGMYLVMSSGQGLEDGCLPTTQLQPVQSALPTAPDSPAEATPIAASPLPPVGGDPEPSGPPSAAPVSEARPGNPISDVVSGSSPVAALDPLEGLAPVQDRPANAQDGSLQESETLDDEPGEELEGDEHKGPGAVHREGAERDRPKRFSKNAVEFYKKGNALIRTRQYPQAILHFKKALKEDPLLALAHRGLGICFAQLQNNKKACTEYRRYLQLLPPDSNEVSALKKILQKCK